MQVFTLYLTFTCTKQFQNRKTAVFKIYSLKEKIQTNLK